MEKKALSLEEIKAVEIGILDHIDTICKKFDIQYFLAYGTLIGAIRHKGFIPWDDDIDICMKRSDYNKFISVCAREGNSQYRLLHPSVDDSYFYEFAKVVDERTKVSGVGVEDIPNEGVWVDIFPLDYVARHAKLQRILIQACMIFRILSVYTKFPAHRRSKLFYPLWLLARLIGFKLPLKCTDWLSRKGSGDAYIGYIASMSSIGAKYCYPVDWFNNSVSVEFEGRKYPAPEKYHEYLTSQYGDYMQLPPEDKRVAHSVGAFWR